MVLKQANIFLVFIFDGILIGILFDIFRVLRKNFKTPDVVTYLEDILFWILTGVILLYSIFIVADGETSHIEIGKPNNLYRVSFAVCIARIHFAYGLTVRPAHTFVCYALAGTCVKIHQVLPAVDSYRNVYLLILHQDGYGVNEVLFR